MFKITGTRRTAIHGGGDSVRQKKDIGIESRLGNPVREMRMKINQARRHNTSCGIDDLSRLKISVDHAGNVAVEGTASKNNAETDKAAKKIIDALGIGPGSGKPKEEATVPETKKERGKGGKPAGKMSGLDAAHEILKEQNREMNVKEITELAISSGKWSPNGKTP